MNCSCGLCGGNKKDIVIEFLNQHPSEWLKNIYQNPEVKCYIREIVKEILMKRFHSEG